MWQRICQPKPRWPSIRQLYDHGGKVSATDSTDGQVSAMEGATAPLWRSIRRENEHDTPDNQASANEPPKADEKVTSSDRGKASARETNEPSLRHKKGDSGKTSAMKAKMAKHPTSQPMIVIRAKLLNGSCLVQVC